MTAQDKIANLNKTSNSLIKMGLLLIALAVIVYAFVSLKPQLPSNVNPQLPSSGSIAPVFEITGALAVDFVGDGEVAETVANLTYKGTGNVNVSYYYEYYRSDLGFGNRTYNVGMMSGGETRQIGFFGRVTWCEVICNCNKVKLTFEPKYYNVNDNP